MVSDQWDVEVARGMRCLTLLRHNYDTINRESVVDRSNVT